MVIHGIPWLKERLREYGLLNEDGTINKGLVVRVPWKGEKFDDESPQLEGEEKRMAQNMKGCAVWMAWKWRPDAKPGVMNCCRHMAHPTVQTLDWIMQVWRYIAGSLDWVLAVRKDRKHIARPIDVEFRTLEFDAEPAMRQYADAWKAADPDVEYDASWIVPKSITGVTVRAFGLLVDAISVVQKNVATSSADAEIGAQLRATKEAVWHRLNLLELLGIDPEVLQKVGKKLTIPISGDNLAALKHGRELVITSKNKHLDVATHLCYEKSEEGEVSFHQVPGHLNGADYFTKPHGAASVDCQRNKFMVLWRLKDPG